MSFSPRPPIRPRIATAATAPPSSTPTTSPAPQWARSAAAIRRFPTADATATEPTISAFLVADDAGEPGGGQMRKSDFLDALFAAVCDTASTALAATIWNAPCPTIEQWFAYYSSQAAEHIEEALRRYAPEANDADSAEAYLPIVTARVRAGIAAYLANGSLEGLPGPLATAGAGSQVAPDAVSLLASEGGGDAAVSPARVQSQLGRGEAMDPAVRGRMETAFGADLSSVRVHDDSNAAGLSDRLGARAFAVGSHVAFGAGEYQPGNPVGDALLAHELAHVMQQRGAAPHTASTEALEQNADRSAESAVASTWSGTRISMSHVRSGLEVQRCSKDRPEETPQAVPNAGPDRKTELQALMAMPDQNGDKIVALIDNMGNDALAVVSDTMPFTSGSPKIVLTWLSGSEGGIKVLRRAATVLAAGDEKNKAKAKEIDEVLKERAAPAPAISANNQKSIDHINKAIDIDPNKSRYTSATPPLKLPVQLFRPGMEEMGGVYYDPSMPSTPPGIAGDTAFNYWPQTNGVRQYPVIYIRLGPLAEKTFDDEYIRYNLFHEFQHYLRDLEFRKPERDKSAETKQLESGANKSADKETEAISIGMVAYFDKLSNAELSDDLGYLATNLPAADPNFRTAAIDRLRAAVAGDPKKQKRLLDVINKRSASDIAALDPLIKAIKAIPPAPPPKVTP